MRLAAIDVGTNSVLLTVADARGGALEPVCERAEITRLGQGVDATGRLSEAGLARTVEVLARFAEEARALGAERLGCVATSAARDASNGGDFLNRVRALGLDPEIISGDREAALVFRAASAEPFGRGPLCVLDIGGGSTEIVYGEGAEISFHSSLQLGSVRLTERLVHGDPPTPHEKLQVAQAIEAGLSAIPPPPPGCRLVGVAGTLTTLSTLAQGLPAYDAARVHGAVLSLADLSALSARLWSMEVASRRKLPGLQPLRADVLPVGASIALGVLFRLRLPELTVSDRGVRWGLLRELAERAG
ncbi:MAG: Ppx/GppA phosphatase family protein [Deltaproteobacteria bacterium]